MSLELTDKAAISLAFDYYTGLGFSIANSYILIYRLFEADVGGLIKFACDRCYEQGYEKGVRDEIQVIQQP